jgi:hypothetical protein
MCPSQARIVAIPHGEYIKFSGASYRLKGRKFDLERSPTNDASVPEDSVQIQSAGLTTTTPLGNE